VIRNLKQQEEGNREAGRRAGRRKTKERANHDVACTEGHSLGEEGQHILKLLRGLLGGQAVNEDINVGVAEAGMQRGDRIGEPDEVVSLISGQKTG
jgi:hypothetical protein